MARQPPGDQSVGELVRQLSEQATRLARQEVELARVELGAKGRRAGLGAGMFGAAGLVGLFGLGALTAGLILVVATQLDAWLAAFIVAGGYALLVGILALIARVKVRQATPPVPEQAGESVKEDVEWAKTRARAGRQ
ncbi:MAG: phage holin family protein [Solirubrobacteraceae bacterium]